MSYYSHNKYTTSEYFSFLVFITFSLSVLIAAVLGICDMIFDTNIIPKITGSILFWIEAADFAMQPLYLSAGRGSLFILFLSAIYRENIASTLGLGKKVKVALTKLERQGDDISSCFKQDDDIRVHLIKINEEIKNLEERISVVQNANYKKENKKVEEVTQELLGG